MRNIKYLILVVGIYILKFLYFFIKFIPTRKKITLISRQQDDISIDFLMLKKVIEEIDGSYKIEVLTKKIGTGLLEKISYIFHILKQMVAIASSEVVVLDGYCIAVSILTHKSNLKIIQIWHSLIPIKKFGLQILDKKEGSDHRLAKVMKMHENYSMVIAPSKAVGEFYKEAFGSKNIKILGMPRIDYLRGDENNCEKIIQYLDKRSVDVKKLTILYAPTFRKDRPTNFSQVIEAISNIDCNLLIRKHPLEKSKEAEEFEVSQMISTMDLLKFADYIITDYSSVAIEGAIAGKKVLFYLYDYEAYNDDRGLNVNPFKEFPSISFGNIGELLDVIVKGSYDDISLNNFLFKYIETLELNNTKMLVEEILRK